LGLFLPRIFTDQHGSGRNSAASVHRDGRDSFENFGLLIFHGVIVSGDILSGLQAVMDLA
jgi:hypothetical protein